MYLAAYKPDSVYFKEVFAAKSASLDDDSLVLDNLLKKSSAEQLGRPAIVSGPTAGFKGFEDNLPGSRMLAKWNMNYFHRQNY